MRFDVVFGVRKVKVILNRHSFREIEDRRERPSAPFSDSLPLFVLQWNNN